LAERLIEALRAAEAKEQKLRAALIELLEMERLNVGSPFNAPRLERARRALGGSNET